MAVFALAWLLPVGIAAAQTPVPPKPELTARTANTQQLRGAWYPWDPYQYRDYKRGVPILTGFDVEIERALARIMSVEILLPEVAWEDHLAALAAGTGDIAAGATFSEARSRYAYFSKPYRTETDVLILPRGASGRYPFRTIEQMLDTFAITGTYATIGRRLKERYVGLLDSTALYQPYQPGLDDPRLPRFIKEFNA